MTGDERGEYKVTVTASAPFARLMVQMLEDAGGEVRLPDGFEWPVEQRIGLPDVGSIEVGLFWIGVGKALDKAVAQMRERWPAIKVFVEEQREFHREQGDGL